MSVLVLRPVDTFGQFLLLVLGFYAVLGLLFAVPFVARGVNRIDPGAADGTWGFRVLILPGTVLLWPLLLRRWLKRQAPPSERNAHRDRVTR